MGDLRIIVPCVRLRFWERLTGLRGGRDLEPPEKGPWKTSSGATLTSQGSKRRSRHGSEDRRERRTRPGLLIPRIETRGQVLEPDLEAALEALHAQGVGAIISPVMMEAARELVPLPATGADARMMRRLYRIERRQAQPSADVAGLVAEEGPALGRSPDLRIVPLAAVPIHRT